MLNLKISPLVITVLLFFLVSGSGLALATQYPLKVSVDGRHLEDQVGTPFLINGDTPWSLIVKLTKAEAEVYLEDRRSRGFNTVIVEIIENKFGGPYNRDGEYPFLSLGDFSQPNEAYFQHADWVINKAAEKGMLVILTPAYIGYNCGGEGWCPEMKATSLDNLRGYGNFLGNRYKSYDNIIWMHGGDAAAGDFGASGHVNAIADGIREVDPGKIFSAHCSRQKSAIDCYNETWLEINNTYSGCDLSASKTKLDYQRSPVMPFFYAEGRYEGEGLTTGRCIRSQAYWSVLGGSTGHFFGNNPIWLFDPGWQTALDLPGSRDMTHFGKLFASRPWSLLVPDYAEVIVSGNRGVITNKDYVMAARASNGSVIMAYLPKGQTVTVDMSKVAGSVADAWWYDPEKGNSQYLGEFPTSGLQDFTPLDTSDWMLVIDNADLGFPPPGGSGAVPATQCADGLDNDTDGLIDFPNDPGCASATDNDENDPPPPAQCNDGVDNDSDGLTDYPADPGCSNALDNDEFNPPLIQCNDGIDNDTDGLIDFPNDPGCASATDNDENDPPPPAQCNDGVDNDSDGLTDYPADPGCSNALDNDEFNPPLIQCNDGIDNDTDGLIDFPNDPGCASATDNDEYNPPPPAGSLQFSAPTYSVAENGTSAIITVRRVGGSFGAARVNYQSSNGSATAGSDYTAVSGTLNFADGDTVAKTFTIAMIDDATFEGAETVNLALSNVVGASLVAPLSAVLTITENDPVPPTGSLQFSAPTYSVAENGTSAIITVRRVGGSFGAARVNYQSSNGSATAGSDYTAVSGTLSFADGDAVAKTFTIPMIDDATFEGAETVNLALSNVVGASLVAPLSAVLTITENDPVPSTGSLQFSAPTYSVAENGTSATITVRRVGGSFGAARVNYQSSNGSATAGSDYTAVSGTLNFADGDTVAKTFTIPMIDDATFEGAETVNLALSNGVGAILVAPLSAVLTITENDPLPQAAQCNDGVDNDADGLTDLVDPGCSNVSDSNESDDPLKDNTTISDILSQSNVTQSEGGSLEPFTLLLLFCAFVALRRRAGVA